MVSQIVLNDGLFCYVVIVSSVYDTHDVNCCSSLGVFATRKKNTKGKADKEEKRKEQGKNTVKRGHILHGMPKDSAHTLLGPKVFKLLCRGLWSTDDYFLF